MRLFNHVPICWLRPVRALTLACTIAMTSSGVSLAQACLNKPLEFGILVPGQTKTVDKYATEAMCHYRQSLVTGTYQVSIVLPESLTNGSTSLPLTFSADDAVYWYYRAIWVGPIEHDPANVFTTQSSTRDVVVRMGATIYVPSDASSGIYSNTIIITMTRISF